MKEALTESGDDEKPQRAVHKMDRRGHGQKLVIRLSIP